MQPANVYNSNKKKKTNYIVWLMAFFLAVLVVITVSIVASCLYDYVHKSDCQISLYDGKIANEPIKNAVAQKREIADPVIKSKAVKYRGVQAKEQSEKGSFQVEDNTQIWKTETAVELFKTEYKNKDGAVTVKSADGKEVVAPGTEGSYTFSLKNTGDVTADYKIWVEAELSSNMKGIPIETRMESDHGWMLGEKNSWEQATALNGVARTETIGAGRTAEYTIYWQWPFEQGKDTTDTNLGDASVDQEMSYTVTIYTMTANTSDGNGGGKNDNSDKKDKNPFRHIREIVKTGDNTHILLWLSVLIAATGILLFLLIAKRRKSDEESEQHESGSRR